MNDQDRNKLDRLAAEWRYVVADMICRAGSGHIGGTMSLVEILITLYYRILRIDPQNPAWEDRDRLIVSKGHAGPVVYTALAYKGYFPREELLRLNADGTNLPSHCDMLRTPGIDMTAGSLGQGLSAAAGMALGGKKDNKNFRVFCIIGDGESNEGQIWEAAMFAAHHKLSNLIGITDRNRLQIDDYTRNIVDMEPLADKWRAFGWEVFEMDGHDWDDIDQTLRQAMETKDKPSMVIAHTKKARGVRGLEDQVACHHIRVANEQRKQELLESLAVEGFNWPE